MQNNAKTNKIKKSLRYSIFDGVFYSAMVGIGESFFSAFAVFLKATSFQLGLLGSLPQLLGALSQLFSNKILDFTKSRKKVVLIGAFLQGLMYLPIALVFFFGRFQVFHLVFFICLYWIFSSVISPAWNSWMGDLVPENSRGSYFGKRNKFAGFASFFAFLIGGFILQRIGKEIPDAYVGFALIFGAALAFRMISVIYLSKKYEPSFEMNKSQYFSFIEFIKKAGFNNYGMFVIYLSVFNFAVYIAAPFFSAYMLSDLKLSYLDFTIVTATSLFAKFIMMPIWGKAADKFGSIKVLSLTGILIAPVSLLWLFSHSLWYLILIQIYSGFVWAGFEIASFKFIYDTTTPQKRPTCVAYYNVLNGIGMFAGAIVGSIILYHNNVFWSSFLLVFLVSSVARLLTTLFFLPRIKEVRHVESISKHELFFNIVTTLPNQGIVHELITFVNPSAKKDKLDFQIKKK
ncbi:MAG: MFS transporter [archaeon]